MKSCQSHWDQLRAAIEDRGLSQFISGDGHKVIEKMDGELNGAPEKETFDPLMSANFAIWTNALKSGGLYLMVQAEDGSEYCPICESEKHGGYPAEWWITHAADDELARARDLGLISIQ